MMKRNIVWAFFLCPLFSLCQGVDFTEGLSWEQVKAKAKAENKYIFVDAYATWCGPCKKMDEEVYPNSSVGVALNDHYIAVRLQMDKTITDNAQVRSWYAVAENLQEKFSITAYPSLLFLSPDEKLLRKSVGGQNPEGLITLAKEVLDPATQLSTQVELFKAGKMSFPDMRALALKVHTNGDKNTAYDIAAAYKKGYLDKLGEAEFFHPDPVVFFVTFSKLVSPADRLFKAARADSARVNALVKNIPDFSERLVNSVIMRIEIADVIYRDGKPVKAEPDWLKISRSIQRKYGQSFVEVLLLPQQMAFYQKTKNWPQYAYYFDVSLARNPPKPGKGPSSGPWNLNGTAWNVFLNCNDKTVLAKALAWSELSIRLDQPEPRHDYMDTRANLLYKLGRTAEAITQEEATVELCLSYARQIGKTTNATAEKYKEFVRKMKAGQPTWPVENP